jgi:hypothetical protein
LPSVSVGVFTSEDEARHVAALLEAEGIPCRVARRDTFGVGPILGSGFPFGAELLVPPGWEERAAAVLESSLRDLPEPPPDDNPVEEDGPG